MKEDDYARLEALCAGFQRQWIADLRDTLRAHGIADEVAKSVCGDFSFALSMLLDQGEIAYQGRMYRPFVAFEAESGDEEPGEMIVEPLGPEFHEYAYGTTEEAWEDTGRPDGGPPRSRFPRRRRRTLDEGPAPGLGVHPASATHAFTAAVERKRLPRSAPPA